ncbi:PASTA domain-containing protein [Saccharomonospora sp. NPDC006951]
MRKSLVGYVLFAALIGIASACAVPETTRNTPASEPAEQQAPASSSAAPTMVEMPAVEGDNLKVAMDTLDSLGITNVLPQPTDGHAFVANPANWIVVTQDPAAGTRLGTDDETTLQVAKTDEAESKWCGDGDC